MLELMGKKIFTFYDENFCLSKLLIFKEDPASVQYSGNYCNDNVNAYDDNYQIQQYHEEIRNHYAQQNPNQQVFTQQPEVQIATSTGIGQKFYKLF